jgi:hypothetical protein
MTTRQKLLVSTGLHPLYRFPHPAAVTTPEVRHQPEAVWLRMQINRLVHAAEAARLSAQRAAA